MLTATGRIALSDICLAAVRLLLCSCRVGTTWGNKSACKRQQAGREEANGLTESHKSVGGGSLPSIDRRSHSGGSTRLFSIGAPFDLPSRCHIPQNAPVQLDATSVALRRGSVSSACANTVYCGLTPRRAGSGRTQQHEQPNTNLSYKPEANVRPNQAYQLPGLHTREKRKAAA